MSTSNEPAATPAGDKHDTSIADLTLTALTISLMLEAACRRVGVPGDVDRLLSKLIRTLQTLRDMEKADRRDSA